MTQPEDSTPAGPEDRPGWPTASADGPEPFVTNPGMPGAGDAGSPITASGPLAEGEPEGVIPPSPLWAMKVSRHFQWSHLLSHDRIRQKLGEGDDALYVMDDGHSHCIVGRPIGQTGDGCQYSLVARITKEQYASLASRALAPRQAFESGTGRSLYGVVDDGPASNVFVVGTFGPSDPIPDDYLPPHPAVDFPADLDEF